MVAMMGDTSAKDDRGNGNENSSLLIQKINVLLLSVTTSGSGHQYCGEQLLAALVLLTRVPKDDDFTHLMTTVINSCHNTVHQMIAASEFVMKQRCRDENDDGGDKGEDTDLHYPKASVHGLVVRLFVQLLHRTYHIQTQQQQGDKQIVSDILFKYNSLMSVIMRMHDHNENGPNRFAHTTVVSVQQRLELLSCLQAYYQYMYQCHIYSTGNFNANIIENDTLTVMWRLAWCDHDNHHPTELKITSADADDTINKHTCTGSTSITLNAATSILEQTLDRLLNESSRCSENDSDVQILYYHRMLQYLLQCTHTYMDIQCMRLASVLVPMPTFFALAISQWTQQQRQQLPSQAKSIGRVHQDKDTFSAQEVSLSWAFALLSILHKWLYMRSMDDSSGDNSCVRSGKLLPWERIQKFLLICIVTIDDRSYNELTKNIPEDAPTQYPTTIRSTAWSCISLMSTTIGLQVTWVVGGSNECTHADSDDAATAPTEPSITTTNSACHRFGVWKNFCSLVRFATGEWKIHLTMIIDQFTFPATESDAEIAFTKESKQQEIMTVSSISDFLVATISSLVQFADDDDNHDTQRYRMLPPSDAIQHLQQSLMEVHVIATQYLELANSTNGDTVTIDIIDECVDRVFTALASELES